MLLYTYATQHPIGTRARSLHVGTPAHVYTVPVARLITAARVRSYTTLTTVDEPSPSGTALKGAISSAVAHPLATTFTAEAVVDAGAQRDSPALEFTQTHAEPIGAAPGIGTRAPHPECKSIFLPPCHGATGGPTNSGPPVLADTAGPRGTENRLGRFATEKRQPYQSSRRSAPGAHGYTWEGTENPSEAEDPRRRHRASRKNRDRRYARYRDAGGADYPSDDNREGRYTRYRDAGGGGYPSDDDDTESNESRRSDGRGHHAHYGRRFRGEDSNPEGYSSPGGEGDRHCRGRDRRSASRRDPKRLPVIGPLNDLFTKAVDYRTYRLESRSARYEASTARRINRYRKKLDVQMKTPTFGGQDPIAVLGFLAQFKMACDHNGVSEGAAVWCFQLYLTGQAHAFPQSRLHGNSMAIDAEQRELSETYAEVVNFLLRTYATDEVFSKAVGDVTSFCQSSNMTEEVYSNQLWDKALRCGTVFSDRRLKFLFVEGLLPATCAQVRNYLATRPSVDYQAVARYAQAFGETHRSARRQSTSFASPQAQSDSVRRGTRNTRTRPVLSVESISELPTSRRTETEDILAVTDQSVTPSTHSSPPTSYHLSPASSSAGAPMAPAHQGDVRAYPYGRPVQNQRVRFFNQGPPGPPPCRFCLDLTHRQEQCPVVAESALWSKLLEARQANYQNLRIRQGLRLGSLFQRQPPTAWQNSRAQQAPTGINVVEPREAGRWEEDALSLTDEGPEDLALTGESREDA